MHPRPSNHLDRNTDLSLYIWHMPDDSGVSHGRESVCDATTDRRRAPDRDSAAGYFGLADVYTMIGRMADAARMFAMALAIYREIDHPYIHSLCSFIELRWLCLASCGPHRGAAPVGAGDGSAAPASERCWIRGAFTLRVSAALLRRRSVERSTCRRSRGDR